MISFHETVESLERVNDLLKSAAEVRSAVSHTLELLADFTAMLEYSHTKEFKDTGEALDYVDKVLVPRVSRIRDALARRQSPISAGWAGARVGQPHSFASSDALRREAPASMP
jgi:hypothetical protein